MPFVGSKPTVILKSQHSHYGMLSTIVSPLAKPLHPISAATLPYNHHSRGHNAVQKALTRHIFGMLIFSPEIQCRHKSFTYRRVTQITRWMHWYRYFLNGLFYACLQIIWRNVYLEWPPFVISCYYKSYMPFMHLCLSYATLRHIYLFEIWMNVNQIGSPKDLQGVLRP